MEMTLQNENNANAITGASHEEALKAAITNYMPRLYRIAFRTLRNEQDAEDALQDALLSAFKNVSQFKGESQISTWLTTIVLNSARMSMRRRVTRKTVSFDEMHEDGVFSLQDIVPDGKPTPEELCSGWELLDRLELVAQGLSKTIREAFVLVVIKGFSTIEAARKLGVSKGTLRTRLFHARRKVAQMLHKTTQLRSAKSRLHRDTASNYSAAA